MGIGYWVLGFGLSANMIEHTGTTRVGAASVDGTLDFNLAPLVDQLLRQKRAEIVPAIDAWKKQTTQWAKDNHPWQNQTGNAEGGLGFDDSIAVLDLMFIALYFTGGVQYQEFLEIGHGGGEWPVIGPAINLWGPVLIGRLGGEVE